MAKEKKTYERTINKNLFEAWQMLRRTDDVRELSEITGKSNPIIYRALNYGHIKDESITETISRFYENRAESQKEQAKKILNKI